MTRYYAPRGELHSFERGSTLYQVHAGPDGSVRALTDSTGAVVASYSYATWGEILSASEPSGFVFPYKFCGSLGVRHDNVTGLYYMRNRWYDPGLARFISRDPKRSANRYSYAADNPSNLVDTSGLEPNWVWQAAEAVGQSLGAVVAAAASQVRPLQEAVTTGLLAIPTIPGTGLTYANQGATTSVQGTTTDQGSVIYPTGDPYNDAGTVLNELVNLGNRPWLNEALDVAESEEQAMDALYLDDASSMFAEALYHTGVPFSQDKEWVRTQREILYHHVLGDFPWWLEERMERRLKECKTADERKAYEIWLRKIRGYRRYRKLKPPDWWLKKHNAR